MLDLFALFRLLPLSGNFLRSSPRQPLAEQAILDTAPHSHICFGHRGAKEGQVWPREGCRWPRLGAERGSLTLLNNVDGLNVDLHLSDNTLNLAAGANSFGIINNVQHVNGTALDDTLTVTGGLFEQGNNPIVDLGGGTNTLNFSAQGLNLTALNIQRLNGNDLGNFVTLNTNVSGMVVDLGAGTNDNLVVARGANLLNVINVESVSTPNFNRTASNDTLSFGAAVVGVSVDLHQGWDAPSL